MDAAIAGLIGAAIGAAGSVGGVWLTQRQQTRRDLVRSAVELARQERDERLESLRTKPGGGVVLPLSVYVAHHADVLEAIAKNRYGPENIRAIDERMKLIVTALHEVRG